MVEYSRALVTRPYTTKQPCPVRSLVVFGVLASGCSADPVGNATRAPQQCIFACEIGGMTCSAETFPDIDASLPRLVPPDCDLGVGFLVVGTCGSAARFLHASTATLTSTVFFDDQGRFLATQNSSDVVDEVCNGFRYFPDRFDCPDAEVTEVVCGESFFSVGDPVDFD